VIVRPAHAGDAAALAELAHRAIRITGASVYDTEQIATWSGSFISERLAELLESTSVFVVEDGDRVAGFASLLLADQRAVVDQLYVDPAFAGQGVARLAVEAVEAAARDAGVDELWADASLLAAPVFEHLGYVVAERYEKPRRAVSFTNTWLRKQLD
jgi:putative acetyltransferase